MVFGSDNSNNNNNNNNNDGDRVKSIGSLHMTSHSPLADNRQATARMTQIATLYHLQNLHIGHIKVYASYNTYLFFVSLIGNLGELIIIS